MNCRHGEGEMLFSSGARYKGQWRYSDMCHGLLDFDEIKNSPTEKYGSRIRKVPTLFAVEFDSEGLVEASPIFSSARSIKKTGTLKDTFEHGARTEYYAALQAKDLAKTQMEMWSGFLLMQAQIQGILALHRNHWLLCR